MKKIIKISLLLCGLCGFAQSNFIQVHVVDTLWVKMESFDYSIVVSAEDYGYDDIYAVDSTMYDYEKTSRQMQEERLKRENERLAAVQKLLTKNGFEPKPLQNIPTAIIGSGYSGQKGYVVTIKKVADALRLQDILRPFIYVEAAASNFKFNDFYALEERLMKKAMAHARKKAEVLAKESGQKLGKVLEINEADVYTTYTSDSYVDDSYSGAVEQKMVRVLPKTITVKYALE